MDLGKVALASPPLQLADSVNERCALNISHGATKLNDAHIWLLARLIHGNPSDPLNPILNRVGDVGHDLNGFAEEIADSLAVDGLQIDLPGLHGNAVRLAVIRED